MELIIIQLIIIQFDINLGAYKLFMALLKLRYDLVQLHFPAIIT